jgi:hypothetical protein
MRIQILVRLCCLNKLDFDLKIILYVVPDPDPALDPDPDPSIIKQI